MSEEAISRETGCGRVSVEQTATTAFPLPLLIPLLLAPALVHRRSSSSSSSRPFPLLWIQMMRCGTRGGARDGWQGLLPAFTGR